MPPRKHKSSSQGAAHSFGGDWTDAKLEVLANYLSAYTTALKKSPFKKGYIDAFAGTGYRILRQISDASEILLFPDLADAAPQQLLDGSAKLALKTDPRFDRYVFIEQSAERCAHLNELKREFPILAPDILIEQAEANRKIQELCQRDWSGHRAVLFLDPYGMQVEWKTIEAVAGTQAIDLWILFPLGMGVNRLVTKTGDIPDSWRKRLDLMLGTRNWFQEFYQSEKTDDLFGNQVERLIKAKTEVLGRFFINRLKTVFPGVSENPGVLRNSNNNPLYLLCFAAGNAKGAPIALNIANSLLKRIQ